MMSILLLFLFTLTAAQQNDCLSEDGAVHNHGDVFFAPDGCNECACLAGGTVMCTMLDSCMEPEPTPEPAPRLETLAPRAQCEYGMMLVDPGYTWTQDCNDCECLEDGSVSCTNETCCLFLDQDGNTDRAFPGASFHNGCNWCTCSDNGMAACTRMACFNKCFYSNWDGVAGYSQEAAGQYVATMAEGDNGEYDCPKFCRCEAGRRGANINCNMDDGQPEPCIAF